MAANKPLKKVAEPTAEQLVRKDNTFAQLLQKDIDAITQKHYANDTELASRAIRNVLRTYWEI